MKTLIIAVSVFTIMIVCIVINFIYINDVADTLTDMVYDIPSVGIEGCYSEASKLDEYWQDHHDKVRLSVSYIELNRVSDEITSMKNYARASDDAEFENSRQLLLNAIHEMRRLESFKLCNLL